jgi:hypothetical protein
MAATVTGFFGNEAVELNNAATESTLNQLLQEFKNSSNLIKNLANKIGIPSSGGGNDSVNNNSAAMERNTTVADRLRVHQENAAASFYKFDRNISSVIGSLEGGNLASGIMSVANSFSELNPLVGVAVSLFSKLYEFQQENFKVYQQLSASGVNFAGSLTDLRQAAASSYLTLSEFSNLISKNSEAFARMGGTANDGAMAFAKASSDLIKGPVGANLMALGYTTEQVNQGLVSYIANTGGRTATEMKNTKDLAAGASSYLTELDALAEITGKSREAQEQELKQLQANQAFQAYMQTLDETGKAKANAALLEAQAKGGKGAAEALQANLMGLPPMTKAAQEFTAIAPEMASANNKMADAVRDTSVGMSGIKRAGDELGVAANKTKEALGQTGTALIMQGGDLASTMGTIYGTANRNAQQGVKTAEDAAKQRDSIEARQRQREESQAATMSDANRAMKELYEAVMEVVNPIVEIFTPIIDVVSLALKGLMLVIKPAITPFIWVGQILGFLVEKLKHFLNLFGGAFKEKEPQLKTTKVNSPNVEVGNKLNKKSENLLTNELDVGNNGVSEALRDSMTQLPPMTNAAQQVISTAPEMISSIKNQADRGNSSESILPGILSGTIDHIQGAITGGVAGALVGGPMGALTGVVGGLLIGENRIGNISKSIGETINNLFIKQNEEEANARKATNDTKLEAGQSTDEQIIAHLKKQAEELEKSRKLHERTVRHLDDINSNTDNSGTPQFV